MAIIKSDTIQVAQAGAEISITWETDAAGNTGLRLATLASPTAALPGFDTLPNKSFQQAGVLLHTYTLRVGVDVQPGQSYGGYPVTIDDGSGDPMLDESGAHPSVPAFTVASLAGPVGSLTMTTSADGFAKGQARQVSLKAGDANGQVVSGVTVNFGVAVGSSPPANHGTFNPASTTTGSDGSASSQFTPARPGDIQVLFSATAPNGDQIKDSETLHASPK